jgi:hypothetical protein
VWDLVEVIHTLSVIHRETTRHKTYDAVAGHPKRSGLNGPFWWRHKFGSTTQNDENNNNKQNQTRTFDAEHGCLYTPFYYIKVPSPSSTDTKGPHSHNQLYCPPPHGQMLVCHSLGSVGPSRCLSNVIDRYILNRFMELSHLFQDEVVEARYIAMQKIQIYHKSFIGIQGRQRRLQNFRTRRAEFPNPPLCFIRLLLWSHSCI